MLPHQNPLSTETELEQVEGEYLRAEKEFFDAGRAVLAFQRAHREAGAIMFVNDKAFSRVNALSLNPELSRLCRVREDARALRNQLLNRRAQLLKATGKVR